MDNLVITNDGRSLMARALNSQTSVTFTKVVTTDYSYNNSILTGLTGISDVKQTFNVSNVSIVNQTQVEFTTVFNNEYLETGYFIRALGVYAKDSSNNEILYAVALAPNNPDYLYPFSNGALESVSYKLILSVSNSGAIELTVNDNGYAAESDLLSHTSMKVTQADGAHGIRYVNGLLQYRNNNNQWVTIPTYGVPTVTGPVNTKYMKGDLRIYVRWKDPEDSVDEYSGLVTSWSCTKLIMNTTHVPQNVDDGTVLVTSTVRNQYSNEPYRFNNLTENQTYYLRLFVITSDNRTIADEIIYSTEATQHKYCRIRFEINDSDPSNVQAYNWASTFNSSQTKYNDFNEFFGVVPVAVTTLGEYFTEECELNWDLTTVKGTSNAPFITDNYDIVVKFPRMGYKIVRDSTYINVYLTNDPYHPDYCYDAFKRGNANKDCFYLGAYESGADYEFDGETSSPQCLVSKKYSDYMFDSENDYGEKLLDSVTLSQCIQLAKNKHIEGGGLQNLATTDSQWGITGFHQFTYLQCLYLIKYQNRNSQLTLSPGYTKTSHTDHIGPGEKASSTFDSNSDYINHNNDANDYPTKFLGLVNLWGNMYEFLDGLFISASNNIFTTTLLGTTINDTNYTRVATNVSTQSKAFVTDTYGTSALGFLPKITSDTNGSATTYYCDKAALLTSSVCITGGNWNVGTNGGIFAMDINHGTSYSSRYVGCRLMYL